MLNIYGLMFKNPFRLLGSGSNPVLWCYIHEQDISVWSYTSEQGSEQISRLIPFNILFNATNCFET